MTSENSRLFLFDLDGTLILSGGAGVRALDLALEEVFGITNGMQGIVCDGKTDPAIIKEALSTRRLDSQKNIQQVIDIYLNHLPRTVAEAQGYRVLPGVRESLDYLHCRPEVLCGLATGNVEQGARVKLQRANLVKYFSVGGFGSDSENRAELVRIAIARGKEKLGDPKTQSVVFGDTPRDVAAALAAGATAVGVATGRFDLDALSGCGAHLVLPDLTHPEHWVARVPGITKT